jgi:thiol-disulfide isomerase/thioredoxin
MMNIDPTTIKLEQGKWLECTDKGCTLVLEASEEEVQKYAKPSIIKGLRVGDNLTITGHPYSTHRVDSGTYGIPKLGKFTPAPDGTVTFTPHPEFTGTVTTAKPGATTKQATATNTKALGAEVTEVTYSKEAMSKIHDRFMLELDTTFVFVISVPSQCPPCRTYKNTIKELAKQYPPDSKVVFLTANFDTFDQARAVVGPVKVFPTTVILPALKPNTTFSYVDDPNWQNKPFLSTIQRPGYKQGGSQQQAPLRALISKTLGVVETGLRGVTESLSQLLGTGR